MGNVIPGRQKGFSYKDNNRMEPTRLGGFIVMSTSPNSKIEHAKILDGVYYSEEYTRAKPQGIGRTWNRRPVRFYL